MAETLDAMLVERVEVLTNTVQAMTQRLEVAFKTLEEIVKVQQRSSEALQQATENLEITNQALLDSLGETDAQLDDLAKITAALISLQTLQQQQIEQGQK